MFLSPFTHIFHPNIWPSTCAILMVLAAGFHVVRREYKRTAIPAVLLVLALFVAYGRS